MSKGDSITSAAYNNLQATTSLVLGANPTGYGQFSNTVVSSTQWNSVRTDMIRAYIHQTNNTPAVEDVLAIVNVNPPYLQTIGSSTVISDAILTQYTNFSNFINTNTATSTEGGTGPTADSTLPGTATTTGFFQLVTGSTNYTQIFRTTGPTTPNNKYVENDYIIKVRRPTASTLEFVITFRDDDAGDQTGIGSAVDEEVTGTLTSLVRCTRPSGTGGNVDVPAPTGVATAL